VEPHTEGCEGTINASTAKMRGPWDLEVAFVKQENAEGSMKGRRPPHFGSRAGEVALGICHLPGAILPPPPRSQPMTPPKRTYDFRIVGWQVFTPEEQERIYMQLLTSQNVEVSDAMRKLILEEWPELAHKLARE
jgi:hypothetical protein